MKKILLAILLIGLIGCTGVVSNTEGVSFSRDQLSSIEAGVTTKDDLVELLGEPSDIFIEDGAEKFVYVFKETKTPTYVGGLIENELREKTTTKTLEVVIREGVVSSYKFKEEVKE